MDKNNVYSKAKVIKANEGIETYQLGVFKSDGDVDQTPQMETIAKLDQKQISINADEILNLCQNTLNQVNTLSTQMKQMESNLQNIQTSSGVAKDIDKQVVQAIKDLKHYATFFEQATFQMETKILKTSVSIAKKIINIEIGENSSKIAKETVNNILEKIKTASKVMIHLNPKDYQVLKSELNIEGTHISLVEDVNVTPGGVVIASDLGNFDGNIEAKVNSMLESLDGIV